MTKYYIVSLGSNIKDQILDGAKSYTTLTKAMCNLGLREMAALAKVIEGTVTIYELY